MKGKKIILGVTGGIAAYKAVELLRLLVKQGAEVRVVMTEAAARLVGPATFAALSGRSVLREMFPEDGSIPHIQEAQAADLLVIAPATADFVARAAAGRASDLLSAVVLAAGKPVLLAPAMNEKMWLNPLTQRNLATLKTVAGMHVVEPGSGELACGEGIGRMAEPPVILKAALSLFKADLRGLSILVTAGPTNEAIDPVRFIGNRSSGKMGYAVARAAARRGARVTLVSGPVSLEPPSGVKLIRVSSALEMMDAVLNEFKTQDAIIMAAAVADYRPVKAERSKIKKSGDRITFELVKNPDILAELAGRKGKSARPALVGFAVETEELEPRAKDKLRRKGCAFLVANPAHIAFGGDDNEAVIAHADGRIEKTGRIRKVDLAEMILDRLASIMPSGASR